MTEKKHQCVRCGLCCRHLIIDEISDLDLAREPKLRKYAEEYRSEPGRYHLMTPCPFLINNPGGKFHNLCSIYPTRPNICVAYPDEGKQCIREERQGK